MMGTAKYATDENSTGTFSIDPKLLRMIPARTASRTMQSASTTLRRPGSGRRQMRQEARHIAAKHIRAKAFNPYIGTSEAISEPVPGMPERHRSGREHAYGIDKDKACGE